MTRVALKGLLGRKLRAFLTGLAIVLGVAMISGTYILTDTIKSAFHTVFTTVYAKTDAVISGKNALGNNNNNNNSNNGLPPTFPESLLGRVEKLPGVAAASGGITDLAHLVGRDGKVISGHGAPGLAFSVHPHGDQRFNPLTLTAGTWPVGAHEVDIDANTASKNHYKVGDTIGVIARGPVTPYRVAGIVKIGGVSSLGGATMAIFDFRTAQRIFHKQGRLDGIDIAARPGTSPQQLVQEIRPVLPPTAQVRTAEGEAKQATKDTNGFLSIFNDFLLAFAGVALFVGIFVIANTLSITVTQRTRELATLRTLGAYKWQVQASVLVEAGVIGALASVSGLFLGLALAKGLNALFVHLGIDLPQAGTVFATRTIVVSLAVGIIVTILAALWPAFRATRVAPVSAVREGAVLDPLLSGPAVTTVALSTIAGAVALMLVGLFVGSLSTTQRLLAVGIGAAAVFLGVALLAKVLVPPLARALGWPATRIGGAAGELARGNAMRNPSRTAAASAALMIGLALVTLVAVLASGLKTTFENAVNSVFKGDYALTATDNFSPFSASSANALKKVPGVNVVSGVRAGQGKAFGSSVQVTGVSRDISKVIVVNWQAGSQATPGELRQNGAFVSKAYAKAKHLAVGSTLDVETPTGHVMHLDIRGIYAPPKGGNVYGDVAISTKRFDREYQNPEDIFAFVLIKGGVTPANTRELTKELEPFPDAKIATAAQFKKNQEQGINMLLNLLYILLSLSIIISLFGIVNTLVLTVYERTREIGMLRAIGMTRRQVRRMIRHESIVTALIGAALGIPVGVVLALMVGKAIKYPAFTIPVGTLIVFVIAAILAGLLAAILPARRAAKLNVLEALQYE
jgi:putative ABC transport system permease protein